MVVMANEPIWVLVYLLPLLGLKPTKAAAASLIYLFNADILYILKKLFLNKL